MNFNFLRYMWLDFDLHVEVLLSRGLPIYLTSREPALESTLFRYCVLFQKIICYLLTSLFHRVFKFLFFKF